jgi:uncharacterized membrane protein
MYPRHRLDGLGDAIYGVALTLLVLDIRVPENLAVTDNAGFVALLQVLWPHLLPYLISFLVLSSGWLSAIRVVHRGTAASVAYVRWWRPQLLLVTLMPFTTMIIARYGSVPLVAALYAANLGLMSLCAWGMLAADAVQDEAAMRQRRLSLILMVVLSAGAVALSPWLGARALLLYAIKGLPPRLIRPAASPRSE